MRGTLPKFFVNDEEQGEVPMDVMYPGVYWINTSQFGRIPGTHTLRISNYTDGTSVVNFDDDNHDHRRYYHIETARLKIVMGSSYDQIPAGSRMLWSFWTWCSAWISQHSNGDIVISIAGVSMSNVD